VPSLPGPRSGVQWHKDRRQDRHLHCFAEDCCKPSAFRGWRRSQASGVARPTECCHSTRYPAGKYALLVGCSPVSLLLGYLQGFKNATRSWGTNVSEYEIRSAPLIEPSLMNLAHYVACSPCTYRGTSYKCQKRKRGILSYPVKLSNIWVHGTTLYQKINYTASRARRVQ